MWASVAFVIGLVAGVAALDFSRAREATAEKAAVPPRSVRWLTLGAGVAAALLLALSAQRTAGMAPYLVSIAFATAAVVTGVGSLIRRDRSWPTWVGLVGGLAPAGFWVAFLIGTILGIGK